MEKRGWVSSFRAAQWGHGIAFRLAKHYVNIRFAAWTPEKKQEIIDKVQKEQVYLVDHKLFDGYDLTLWKMEADGELIYMVGLNSNNYSPFDKEIVDQTQPGSTDKPKQNLLNGVDILKVWAEQYGKLLIGTSNERKSDTYIKLLSRTLKKCGFRFQRAHPEHKDMGYFLIPPGID